jgi:NAD+ synthase
VATVKKKAGAKAAPGDADEKPKRKTAAKKSAAATKSSAAKKTAAGPKSAAGKKTAATKTTAKKKTAADEPSATGEPASPVAASTPRAKARKSAAVAEANAVGVTEANGAPPPAQASALPPSADASAPGAPALSGPPFPDTDYAVVEKLLVGFLSHEIRKVGVTRAVLGLSGGVDSAVSAALAARALGPSNVLGIMMPYQSSSPESLADAYEVAQSLGIETAVVEITGQVDAYFSRFADASRLRRGNKMARERMTILYDHSAARSALVIGTSNKTELLLGYGTLYGDMASALNPIGDLYKTQVWGLARHLALPASVIEKAPTADLWSGQTDETELGFSYHQVDRLLYRMIDERCSTAELAEMGFAPDFIERISQTIRKSQFKRRLPVIAKLSARSIDTDFRYSRDWGL